MLISMKNLELAKGKWSFKLHSVSRARKYNCDKIFQESKKAISMVKDQITMITDEIDCLLVSCSNINGGCIVSLLFFSAAHV